MMIYPFHEVAEELELAGLIWHPEIGDEITDRERRQIVSVLVDPQGMTPTELRSVYLWLPTLEQMVLQFEARQAILYHAGLELTSDCMKYKTVVKAGSDIIECVAESLRNSVGLALRNLLLNGSSKHVN